MSIATKEIRYEVEFQAKDSENWHKEEEFTTTEEVYDCLMACRETWPDRKFRSVIVTTETVILAD